MEGAQFQYKSLDHHRQIRLLYREIHPDNDTNASTETYHIRHSDLDSNEPYVAVSYTWGKPDLEHKILISGKARQVTDSLYHAVQDVFPAVGGVIPDIGNELPIWIDGLCIDQDNLEEKTKQVALMGEIYRKAALVVTHAAKENTNHMSGIHLIIFCHDFLKLVDELTPEHLSSLRRDQNLEQFNFPPPGHECYLSLRKLLRLPWSGRAWIVQESVMAKIIFLVVGRTVLPWKAIATVCAFAERGLLPMRCIYSKDDLKEGNTYGSDNIRMLSGLRKEAWTTDGRLTKTLCQLLRRCHSFGSSDPRDKIYAFLGMAMDQDKLNIVPDYQKPATQVYRDVTSHILRVGKNLDLLSSVRPDKALSLPSWVPDWSSFDLERYGPNNYLRNSKLIENGLYQAGGARKPYIEFNRKGDMLTLHGIIFDRISAILYVDCHGAINPDYQEAVESGEGTDTFLSLLGNAQSIIESGCDEVQSKPYPSIKGAFWRTLIANVDDTNQEATQDFEENYDSYVALQRGAYFQNLGQNIIVDEVSQAKATRFASAMGIMSSQRAIGVTSKGYIASIPGSTKIDDLICVALGGRLPLIIRQKNGESQYCLLGDCYTHGIMKGEAIEFVTDENLTKLTFV